MRVAAVVAVAWSTSTAHAATVRVPADQPTLAAAVAGASAGDVILLAPGEHVVDGAILVSRDLTVRGENTPVALGGSGPDSRVRLDVETATAPGFFEGMLQVTSGRSLVVEDVVLAQPESHCGDGEDNDGNGLVDALDPWCIATGATGLVGTVTPDVRAFDLRGGSALTVRRTTLAGWSWGVEGTVIRGDGADVVLDDVRVHDNLAYVQVSPPALTFLRGTGAVSLSQSTLSVTGSTFTRNRGWLGGALHLDDGSVLFVDDSTFVDNLAAEGGAVRADVTDVTVLRSTFVGNDATLELTGTAVPPIGQGGALACLDCGLDLRNAVLVSNGATERAGAVLVAGTLPLPAALTFSTFVANDAGAAPEGAAVVFDGRVGRYGSNIAYDQADGVVGAISLPPGSFPVLETGMAWPDAPTTLKGELAGRTSRQLAQPPWFVAYDPDAPWQTWQLWTEPTSLAIDFGPGGLLDAHGTPADLGAYGGPDSGTVDVDGDGWSSLHDCDDTRTRVRPFAVDSLNGVDEDCDGFDGAPVRLLGPATDEAGGQSRFRVLNTTPNHWVVLAGALRPGSTPVPGCPGATVDLRAPTALARTIDSARFVDMDVPLPGVLAGRTVRFQAVDTYRCEASDLRRVTLR